MHEATIGGEVWMDEHGGAVVVLPDYLHGRELEYQYELRPLGPGTVRAKLVDGRLELTSDAPHLKVVWRLRPRLTGSHETRQGGEG